MKSFQFIIFILIINSIVSKAQNYDLCWPLGINWTSQPNQANNLVFTSTGIRIDTAIREIKFNEACASISDSLGNMLFYTNGCVVANTRDTMVNGDDLNPGPCQQTVSVVGNSITEGSLILPFPGHPEKFLLFNEACNYTTNYSPVSLLVNEIDLSLDSGRGDLTYKNGLLYQDTLCDGSLTAVKHANGIDWWVVVHEKYNNSLVRFLVTSFGIYGPYFQNIGQNYTDDSHGTSSFSPDGNWYATSTQLGGIDLFRFDRCNGLFYERTYLDFDDSIWINSVVFSPNSKLLYTVWLDFITQFDLTALDISASRQIVANYDGFTYQTSGTPFWIPQLGPDHKIYISCPSAPYLHVIDHPDSLGVACNVLQHSIFVPLSSNRTLPNFPNYRLGPVDSLYCDTINSVHEIIPDENNMIVYPNPAENLISLKCKQNDERIKEVFLFDSVGRKSDAILSDDYTINVEKLSEGFYFLRIETNRGSYFKKIMVLH